LKYRSEVCASGSTFPTSRSIHSEISLLSPYGDSGRVGVASVTRSTSGVPNTPALDENTMLATPAASMRSTSTWVPMTFCR
jgi:hypothetical protein